jgi:hypothetical protein
MASSSSLEYAFFFFVFFLSCIVSCSFACFPFSFFFLLFIRLRRRFLLFLLLGDGGSILIRDLALHADKVGDIAGRVAERSNKELIPKRGAIDAIIQQTHGHVIALFNRLADAFDTFGIGLWTLQKATIASENLIERISRQIQESLTGIDNGIVRQGRIGHDKVLLRRLQRLDEAKVGIVEYLVGNALRTGQQAVDTAVGVTIGTGLVQERLGLFRAEMRTNAILELFILLLEQRHRLLQRLEEELFANARALGVFAVAFTVKW